MNITERFNVFNFNNISSDIFTQMDIELNYLKNFTSADCC
jgi:hypothetical protein